MTPEEMRSLYDYNAWANHRSLDAAANLTASSLQNRWVRALGRCEIRWRIFAERNGFGWSVFRDVRPRRFPDVLECKDVDSLRAKWAEQEKRLLDVRRQIDSGRFESRNGIQDFEIWRLQESLVAVDAACGESWDLPPWADYDFAAAAWSAADFDGFDALLSRTRDGGERVKIVQEFRVQKLKQETADGRSNTLGMHD